MNPRALSLIEQLDLKAHLEGGYFREIHRSSSLVTANSSGVQRTAITSIYYLLVDGQVSKFHRVASDEVWHFLEGEPLTLYTLDPDLTDLKMHLLGPVSELARPIRTVPAHHWQAAMPMGAFTLAGCTVAPGFEYKDFVLMGRDASAREKVRSRFPQMEPLL